MLPFLKRGRSDIHLRNTGGGLQREGRAAESVEYFRIVFERNPTKLLHAGEYARALAMAGRLTELRALASKLDPHIYDEMRAVFLHDLTELERGVFLEVCLEACQTPEAAAQLCRSVEYVVKYEIAGDLV